MQRRILPLLLWFCLLPCGCSFADPRLQQLTQEVYNRKTWRQPLPPSPFASDGCSCWPDDGWLECCVEHDAIYWMGGTREERERADAALRECVRQKGHPLIGTLMYHGTRIGGAYWLPTPFRWGFGWPYPQAGPPGTEY
ncbi:MAG: hypothetical protein ACOY3Z_09790 [Thermodesulfobacteriota bacterium]